MGDTRISQQRCGRAINTNSRSTAETACSNSSDACGVGNMIGGVTDVATSPATSIPDTGSADPTSPSNTTNLSVTASTSDINARSPLNTCNPSNHIAPKDCGIRPIVAADYTLLHTRIVITC